MSKHDAVKKRKKRSGKSGNSFKKMIFVIVFLFLVTAVCYGLNRSVLDTDFFHKKSTVNGIDVSGLNADQAERRLTEQWNKRKIKVLWDEKEPEMISDFDLKYDIRRQIENCLHPDFFKKVSLRFSSSQRAHTIKMNAKGVSKGFKKSFDALYAVKEGNDKSKTKTRDAYVDLSTTEFKIVKEIFGNDLDKEKLQKALLTAIADGKTEFKYVPGKFFKIPRIRANSDEIEKRLEYANKYLKTNITISGAGTQYKLTPAELDKMISASDGSINVNEKAVKKFISSIAGKFTTVGIRRKMKLVGGKVDVSGGNYGYVLDEKKQLKELIKALKSGEDREIKAVFKQKGWGSGKNDDIGDTYVEVSISKQHVWYVRKGKTVISTPVVTGNVAEGNGTPTGTFSLMYKVSPSTLEGENNDGSKYKTKVTYWMPFFAGCGFHDAPWRGAFGGNIYRGGGSHGCVNMPPAQAAKLYGNIQAGMPVIVHN